MWFCFMEAFLRDRRRLWMLAMGIGFVLAVFLGGELARLDAVCRQVSADTLRLHIRANSDTLEDQLLKLRVRDVVLQTAGAALEGAADREEARQRVSALIPLLRLEARREIARAGKTQNVTLAVVEEEFAAIRYGEDFALPGGSYMALRIDLGSAEGHNWFCVLYPALCYSAGSAHYEGDEENEIVFGEYHLRLAALDWLHKFTREKDTPEPAAA